MTISNQIDICTYPTISGNISPATRRQWDQFTESRHKGWALSIHEGWLSPNRSRVVLIQSVFMLVFEYKTGDMAGRAQAVADAIAYAEANPFRRVMVGDYATYSFPGAVGFTAPLHSAGWVTDDVATLLNALIDKDDEAALAKVLNAITTYPPEDHTARVREILQEQKTSLDSLATTH
ncbi:hypothetical protein [Burkholderia cenocepacia]|uniref:hypothetical protein n=1 Tax=Burkholderia cenocepacia TaxID=95486 RepID=UPI00076C0B37|nr:hypothetical protein [Burkholderia cenocepacia]KWU26365.1 hypothetical protein AS149_25590 [Burkholderia cenocepacia]